MRSQLPIRDKDGILLGYRVAVLAVPQVGALGRW